MSGPIGNDGRCGVRDKWGNTYAMLQDAYNSHVNTPTRILLYGFESDVDYTRNKLHNRQPRSRLGIVNPKLRR